MVFIMLVLKKMYGINEFLWVIINLDSFIWTWFLASTSGKQFALIPTFMWHVPATYGLGGVKSRKIFMIAGAINPIDRHITNRITIFVVFEYNIWSTSFIVKIIRFSFSLWTNYEMLINLNNKFFKIFLSFLSIAYVIFIFTTKD